jgi:hypothetical protein
MKTNIERKHKTKETKLNIYIHLTLKLRKNFAFFRTPKSYVKQPEGTCTKS